jgi:hypothetical protein
MQQGRLPFIRLEAAQVFLVPVALDVRRETRAGNAHVVRSLEVVAACRASHDILVLEVLESSVRCDEGGEGRLFPVVGLGCLDYS